MLKPRALRPGDRIAIVAPASAFSREQFEAGVEGLRNAGFDPVYDDRVFARRGYVAGDPQVRAGAFMDAWTDPSIAALIAVRGGYGSVQVLPLLDPEIVRRQPKAFIAYSDNTSILTWLNQACGLVAFHGPMLERRFAAGEERWDRDTFERALCRAEPAGEIAHPQMETLKPGEASGILTGGTLTQLVASLGTPYAFDPPPGCVLFLDEIAERPYRLDRMLTQLRLSGLLPRASAILFNELPNCDEPGGSYQAKATVADVLGDFPGPIVFGLPSGHTAGATMTLPFGVRARVVTSPKPALHIEESAVA